MDMAPWNFALGLYTIICFAKIVEFATDTTGFPRDSEGEPGMKKALKGHSNGSATHATNGHTPVQNSSARNGHDSTEESPLQSKDNQQNGLLDAVQLVCACRGTGWAHGEGTYVPPFPFPSLHGEELRHKWLRHAAIQSTIAFILFDAIEVAIKQHPNFRSPGPASIFVPSLPPVQRYALAVLMSFFTGIDVVLGFHSGYYCVGFFCVLLAGHDPRSWPPVQEAPWFATSLHDFWAKRWHQLLRRSFLVIGGWPLQYLTTALFGEAAGQVAIVLGAFLASGMLHTFAQYPIGLPLTWATLAYFALQGVGVGLERVFRIVTGKRMGGWGGWVWTSFWVIMVGMLAMEDWHMHGLGAGIVIPPMLSPVRAVILPLGRRIWGQTA